ncbi:MAG TPA: DJ-1/PfpI family protein [Planctomycetota bacterium]|nr:DJ-1/PfpI family protein [Planctomycetota bacterium]HRR81704.1 DJ-1/PfpI family protein [Planctomycetota bacterium]HRT94099.1 DJ-1/PfpI family protein [Planctomycetota bacterium]
MDETLLALCSLAALALGIVGCSQDGGGSAGAKPPAKPSLEGKRAVFIIAPRDFRDEELREPTALLKARGCTVTIACSSLDEATGMLGAKVKPEALLKDVQASDYDAVVFVGGVGASDYFNDPTAHAVARKAASSGKVLGAICIAPSILARAGLLQGKRATAWNSQKDDLTANGAKWSDEAVVRDGKLITGNGPQAAPQFGERLAQALAE